MSITTNSSNGPVRVRPNPRPPKRVVQFSSVQFRSVPLRKSKRNNKPNHQQFIIHESINTHSTKTRRTPRSEATQSRRHQWKIAPRHRADGPPVLRRTKAMDDVIRQNAEQETENSVNDVSAFISKNKMNDDF